MRDRIGKIFVSYKLFCKYISSLQFDFVTDIFCVNEDCKRLVECLMRGVAYASLPGKAYHNSRCPWITAALIISIKYKHALVKRYKKDKIFFEAYKTYRYKLNSLIRQSKNNSF